MNRNQRGVIHLLLLVVVAVAVIAVVVGVAMMKPDLSSFIRTDNMQKEEAMTEVSPTVTTTEMSDLEKEVNSQDLSDPTTDFSTVDQDINSL